MGSHGFSDTGTTWIGYRRGTGRYRRIQLTMFLAGVATFAQLYAPQAVLPQLVEAFDISIAESSLAVSAGTLGVAVSVLPWSIVADRIGRKRVIAIAVIAATILGFLVTLMPTFELLVAVRVLEGLALGGVPAVAVAYLNEEVHRLDAAAAVGTFIAGNTIGGLSGRLIAGPLGELTGTWQSGFLAVSGLSVFAALMFVLLTPSPQGFLPAGRDAGLGRAISSAFGNAFRHMRDPVLIGLYIQPMLLMGGFVAIYNYLGYHLTEAPFGLPVWLASMVFLAYLAGSISSPLAGRLAGMRGRKGVKLGCDLLACLGLVWMLVPNLGVVVFGLIVFTAAFFGSHSVASGWAGSYPRQGRAQSTALYNLWYYAGSSVFGFLGGLFFQWAGWNGLVFMVLGLILLAMLVGAIFLPPSKPKVRFR
ncbi:MFS transporter [uncultured Agrococcus sp.]|uniref:MFS transporter n=1 Tax=uncultured Agrococcus sp. TaxID=382258 RepID=UPI00260118C7|nr:MFS transporter [uncultured Agrococcus sp.]